jgi:alkylated DNA repair dioxygenase AlkB
MEFIPIINDEPSYFIYIKNVLTNSEIEEIKDWLNKRKNHFQDGICISGKLIPRKQIWFHETGKYFCDSWKVKYDRWRSHQYDEILKKLQKKINLLTIQKLGIQDYFYSMPQFNSCLVNYYRNGDDSIKPHRDSFESFGQLPVISNYSLGETRTLSIKKINYNPDNIYSMKYDTNEEYNLNLELEDNSLFIMAGASQKYFTHEILKSSTENPRYSFTFREHLSK